MRPHTFLTLDNLAQIVLETAVVATAALGMTIVIISGGIDLSVGSNIAVVTVVIALLINQGLNPAAGAIGGILAAQSGEVSSAC